VRRLTPLLRRTGCVVSVKGCRGRGTEPAMHHCLVLGYGSGRAEVLTWNTQNNSDSRDTHTYKSGCSTSTTKIELGNNLAPTTDNVWLQVDFNFTPNRMRTPSIDVASYYTCRTLCSVVYMLVRLMDCANTAEPIDMPFGGSRLRWARSIMY